MEFWYNSVKPTNAYETCPREGFYLIKHTYEQPFCRPNDLMARAIWRPLVSDGNPKFEVLVHLEALNWSKSEGPKEYLNSNLRDRTIKVSKALLQGDDRGVIHLYSKWDILPIDDHTELDQLNKFDHQVRVIDEYLAQQKKRFPNFH